MNHREIITCSNCEGKGTILKQEIDDYHRGTYTVWDEWCKVCGGTGRMYKITKITFEKFEAPVNVGEEYAR